jgi:hypothetical protein
MTSVTLSIEEDDLRQARAKALQEGTSLNNVIRGFVKSYIGQTKRYQQVTDRILQHAEASTFELGNKTWTRGDLYER